jgi:Ca2+/Na+ antiporter
VTSSGHGAGSFSRALTGLRRIILAELATTSGKINCYAGFMLLAFLVVMALEWLDGDAYDIAWLLLALLLFLVYWTFCLRSFAQLNPHAANVNPGRHRRE